ncbi:MAG: UDP-glucose/GDP-mannose dehydrogenase family protein [Patescibacteria group bacterium]|nr:UDP-glucose/GDP-mannose dehydrogenase family protein [Patescibacteria group bacterium]MEA2057050.1 UDP-glucose/GDP-mannose dehydrogenase family protein [Patescibacteria group bacterium]
MKITFIGTGFVGLVSAAVYASFGNQVTGLDIDEDKIKKLKKGKAPFYEPDLEEMLKNQQKKGNLNFTTDYESCIPESELIVIAVGTPSKENNEADLRYVYTATEALAPHLKQEAIVAIKSTVPPGTLDYVEKIIKKHTDVEFYTASLPEFLREGSAVADTLNPDRVLIGANNQVAIDKLEQLSKSLKAPIVKMTAESAQMAKYSANAYLATRITFINQIANLCEQNGADINEVIEGIGYDKRIGDHYWYPGFGYGGSCFPKDVKELAAYSLKVGQDSNLMVTINKLNKQRIPKLMSKYRYQVGCWKKKKVAVLGLAFKPGTDDTRQSPATKVIPWLIDQGSEVTGYDPMATWQPDEKAGQYQQTDSIRSAVKNVDVIICLIEWPQIIKFDFAKTKLEKEQYFIDARNQFEPDTIKQPGYKYIAIGRN